MTDEHRPKCYGEKVDHTCKHFCCYTDGCLDEAMRRWRVREKMEDGQSGDATAHYLDSSQRVQIIFGRIMEHSTVTSPHDMYKWAHGYCDGAKTRCPTCKRTIGVAELQRIEKEDTDFFAQLHAMITNQEPE